jgi:hypothetical protein
MEAAYTSEILATRPYSQGANPQEQNQHQQRTAVNGKQQ